MRSLNILSWKKCLLICFGLDRTRSYVGSFPVWSIIFSGIQARAALLLLCANCPIVTVCRGVQYEHSHHLQLQQKCTGRFAVCINDYLQWKCTNEYLEYLKYCLFCIYLLSVYHHVMFYQSRTCIKQPHGSVQFSHSLWICTPSLPALQVTEPAITEYEAVLIIISDLCRKHSFIKTNHILGDHTSNKKTAFVCTRWTNRIAKCLSFVCTVVRTTTERYMLWFSLACFHFFCHRVIES